LPRAIFARFSSESNSKIILIDNIRLLRLTFCIYIYMNKYVQYCTCESRRQWDVDYTSRRIFSCWRCFLGSAAFRHQAAPPDNSDWPSSQPATNHINSPYFSQPLSFDSPHTRTRTPPSAASSPTHSRHICINTHVSVFFSWFVEFSGKGNDRENKKI
jgi:hypothetical protein